MQQKKLLDYMSLKLFIAIFLLAAVSGCVAGEKKGNTTEVSNMQNISISAEAFRDGGTIPSEYTCDGENISPALSWSGIPAGAKSIALIADDPDAPRGTFVHWIVYNIPASAQGLPKAVPKDETLSDGSRQGTATSGDVGYHSPCPPSGVHRYYFRVYALDTKLDLPPGVNRKQVDDAMKGHILAKGELMGRYGRQK